jgi:Flp pilus assembly protein TadG
MTAEGQAIAPDTARRRRQRGQAILEMGLCMVVLFFMIFGIFQYSQIEYANNFCAYAAQQAGRFASIRGASSVNVLPTSPNPCGSSCSNASASSDPTTAYVQGLAVGLNTANLTVTTAWSSSTGNGNAAGGTVSVTVRYVYSPILALLSANTFTLTGTSTLEVLQ